MADESLPEDDGSMRMWCWTSEKHPRYTRVAEIPLRREEAIRRLRDQRPAELGDVTHVTLAEEDLTHQEPIKPLGSVRVRHTPGEEINRMLAPMLGLTIKMPTR